MSRRQDSDHLRTVLAILVYLALILLAVSELPDDDWCGVGANPEYCPDE